jgi:mono/diheme cytochrome c family protein
MARQPSYRPLEPTTFFADGRSARPLVSGTVARGQPLDDASLVRARKERSPRASTAAFLATGPGLAFVTEKPGKLEDYVAEFPFAISEDDLRRGQQRFTIFCSVCHGPVGNGNGMIVERGYLKPPSFNTEDSRGLARFGIHVPLRKVPVGYFFEVITQGYGGMPDYATQIPPDDRWKIIAYIRALQWSQNVSLDDLPEKERDQVQHQLKERP